MAAIINRSPFYMNPTSIPGSLSFSSLVAEKEREPGNEVVLSLILDNSDISHYVTYCYFKMCKPENKYWLLKQRVLLFNGWRIWITKQIWRINVDKQWTLPCLPVHIITIQLSRIHNNTRELSRLLLLSNEPITKEIRSCQLSANCNAFRRATFESLKNL